MFGRAELGDIRRTQRLVRLTDQLCKHPGGSLPDKLSSPKDLKALYRLCDRDEVTHAALMTAVRQAVLQDLDRRDDTILILHDATELDFSTVKSLSGQLGQVGRGLKRGYLCHNSLAVTPEGRDVVGLVNQILHRRVRVPKNETLPQKRARQSRESRLWLLGTQGLPADWRLVDVADQGADTFEFLQHEVHSGRRFVIRVHRGRKVGAGHEPSTPTHTLQDYVRGLPAIGGSIIRVTAQPRHGRHAARLARTARLLISAAPLTIHPPHAKHGDHGLDAFLQVHRHALRTAQIQVRERGGAIPDLGREPVVVEARALIDQGFASRVSLGAAQQQVMNQLGHTFPGRDSR